MNFCTTLEESPTDRKYPIPLAAKSSQRSGAGLDSNDGGFWKSSVKTLGNIYLLKKCSFCINKLFKNFQKRLITIPFNNLYSNWMKTFFSWTERYFLFDLCSWMYYMFSSSYLRKNPKHWPQRWCQTFLFFFFNEMELVASWCACYQIKCLFGIRILSFFAPWTFSALSQHTAYIHWFDYLIDYVWLSWSV